MTGELEFLRESNARLKNRLSVLEPTKDSEGQDQGSKTLLGEVEDRRQELESANIALSEKHAGLVKSIAASNLSSPILIMPERKNAKSSYKT